MFIHPLSVLSVLASGVLDCLAAMPLEPRWHDVRTKHAWGAVPEHWETLGHPAAGTTIDLHIALEPQRKNAVLDALYEVSYPRSPKYVFLHHFSVYPFTDLRLCPVGGRRRYGAHLSREQLADIVAPHLDTLTLVNSWLKHHGVHRSSVSQSHGGGWLTVADVPISQANNMLSASYQLYRHAKTNETAIRTISYGLPVELHSHVKSVAPTTYFNSPGMLRHAPRSRRWAGTMAAPAKAASIDLGRVLSRDGVGPVTPSFLRWLYNTLGYVPAATDRNKLGVTGLIGDSPSPVDLKRFMTEYRADGAETATFDVVLINGGGYDPNTPSVEGNLDIQYAEAMAFPTPLTYYSTGGGSGPDPYLSWLNFMLSLDDNELPRTISTSYGGHEEAIPLDFAESACELFAQLGVRGVSVLFSTGDFGVGKDCTDRSGNVRFRTMFPASCPWVTSVGGTMDYPEVGASMSGGGFSNYFSRPAYQDGAVPTYLEHLGGQYDGLYNANGRGIPDISAQAYRCAFVHRKEVYAIDGTSCSVPIAAGIVSLLNDYRLSKGKTPLGFLNYWLYDYGIADLGLNDITSGSNPGCNTDGFTASTGWDPVTGLGTLDFAELQKMLDEL
ncbi:subtilisin-like protein [Lactarius akahatsu]|uniref:tripeptidyl-peptidase II n=1 Tax=Lactarius akahatsu TaxID=416441 RepID=A0AAD4Q2V0_9AGAM|nr:subtilisin-like protein [Lactarius akahatsu]